jgi:HAMP domain-containing protein
MGLRLKFNLMLLLVFAVGLGVTGYISHDLLHRNARDEVLRNAGLMMEAALSMRGYTNSQIRPLMPYSDEVFHPQSVPAYSATAIMTSLRKKYTDYAYKEATLNPTNPLNKTVEWEADIVNAFRSNPERDEISGVRDTPTGRSLYLARPLQIKDKACLACHTTAAEAPPAMVKIYGPNNGYGWKHMEVIGAQVVSVPMSLPIQNANRAFYTFMISLSAVFLALFIILNVMMSVLIVRPITRMSDAADKISTGNMDIAEFSEGGKDEVAVLGKSFNRMRRSLAKAIDMINKA